MAQEENREAKVGATESPSRKPWWRRWFGTRSERAAARYLRRQGFRIVARNYRCPLGELDLVALEGDCVVFVEVRSTGSDDVSRPATSVDLAKQRRLTDLGVYFLREHRLLEQPARFDVLALTWPPSQREPTITHYRNAFEAVGKFQMYQ
jgi:putative endonuclease